MLRRQEQANDCGMTQQGRFGADRRRPYTGLWFNHPTPNLEVRMIPRTLVLFTLLLALAACGSGADEIAIAVEATRAAEPLPTAVLVTVVQAAVTEVPVTREVEVTRQIEVTRIIEMIVTATYTATPLNSPTPSATPTDTPVPSATPIPTDTPIPTETPLPTATAVPTATPDLALTATVEAYGTLAEPKGSGFFTVGTEILPGKWRSTGSGSGCYWARLDANQDLLDNHFGYAGGTVNVQPGDYEIELDGCGTWTYVENEVKALLPDATSPKENGFYTVGVEIAPGRWQSTGSSDNCYWARLTGTNDILDNHFGNAGGTVNIGAGDYEVTFEDCGVWEYLGP
jgi:hypothetical protein